MRRRALLQDLPQAVNSHATIAEAFGSRDPQRATEVMRLHIETSYRHEPI